MPVHELAVQLAARVEGIEPSAVTETDYRPVRMDLRHRCLPQLVSIGWVERRATGVVAVDDSLSFETERLSPPNLHDPDHPFWDVVSVLLARPYRQDLTSILADRSQHVALESLATELLALGRTTSPDVSDDGSLSTALHHIDLPKLASAGVVEYDRTERTAARTDRLLQFADWSNLDTGPVD